MIWDCFMFRGDGPEPDLLEFRLTHMQDYDVIHVLSESAHTHRGDPKPLWYQDLRGRYAPWRERVVRVEAILPSRAEAPGMDPWQREHLQRDAALSVNALNGAMVSSRTDLVLISDLDEFPDMPKLDSYAKSRAYSGVTGPVALQQRVFAFAVDWEFPWLETTSAACGTGFLPCQLSAVRDGRSGYPLVEDAGWHFSWLGGSEAIRGKAGAHCHAELDEKLLQGAADGSLYERGAGVWGCSLMAADVDESWPEYIYKRRCPPGWFRPRREGT